MRVLVSILAAVVFAASSAGAQVALDPQNPRAASLRS
jgi:hypothetical protein